MQSNSIRVADECANFTKPLSTDTHSFHNAKHTFENLHATKFYQPRKLISAALFASSHEQCLGAVKMQNLGAQNWIGANLMESQRVCVCHSLRMFFFVLEKFAMQKRLSVSSSKRIWDFPKKMHFTEPKPSAKEKKHNNTIRKMRTISLNEVCHFNWIAYLPRFSMDPFVVMVAGNSCKNRHNASLKKNFFVGISKS